MSRPIYINNWLADVTDKSASALVAKKESILLVQLNDLIRTGALVITETHPVFTYDPDKAEVRVSQSVKLSFEGAERMLELRVENELLKARLEEIQAAYKAAYRTLEENE